MQGLNDFKDVKVPCRGSQQHLFAHFSLFSSHSHGPNFQPRKLLTVQWRLSELSSEKKTQPPFWEPHSLFPFNIKASAAQYFSPVLCDSVTVLHVSRPVAMIVSLQSCTVGSCIADLRGGTHQCVTKEWISAHCECPGAGVSKREPEVHSGSFKLKLNLL